MTRHRTHLGPLFALAILFAAPHGAGAKTYYVDNSSARANDANPGTAVDLPLLSVKKAVSLPLVAGDVIAIRAGTRYVGGVVLTKSGSSAAPLTLTTFGTGGRAELSNTGSYSDALQVSGARYVVIDNLKFTGANQAGVNVDKNSQYVVVQNSEFTGVGIGIKVSGQFNKFTKNLFHHLAMVKNTPKSVNPDDDYGGNSFVISGSNNEFSFNTATDCRAVSYDYGHDGGMFEFYGDVSNVEIHHNYDENDEGFLESGAGAMSDVRIHHNVAVNNDGAFATIHLSGAFKGSARGVRIENNTIIDVTAVKAGALNYVDATTGPDQVVFRNNIFVINQIGSIWKNPTPRDHNLYWFQSKQTHMMNNWSEDMGVGELRGDPQFVNLAAGDYHLRATSPAVRVGVDVGFALDFDLRPIPSANPSLGAYELVVAAAPVPTPAPTAGGPVTTAPGDVSKLTNWSFPVNDRYGKIVSPMSLDPTGFLRSSEPDAGSYARASYFGLDGSYAIDVFGQCAGAGDAGFSLKLDQQPPRGFSLNASGTPGWQRVPATFAFKAGFHSLGFVGLGGCAQISAVRVVKLD